MQLHNRIVVSALSAGLVLGGFAASSHAALVLLDGESPDSGQTATNKLGASGVTFYHNAVADSTPADAKFGSGSFDFTNGQSGNPANELELLSTQSLGSAFTIGAQVNFTSPVGYERLFSANPLFVLQVLQFSDSNYGGQLNLQIGVYNAADGKYVIPMATYGLTPTNTAMNAYHAVALTYDGTTARLYWEGNQITSAAMTAPSLTTNLFVAGDPGGTASYPFYGRMDDIFVYDQALSAQQVSDVALNGAAVLVPEPASLGLLLGGAMLMAGRRRRRAVA